MQVKYKGLPVFLIGYTEDSIFNNVSLVEFPAIEQDFLKFSKQEELKFSVDEEERVVTGPVMIPDMLIYRKGKNGKEFYVKMEAETIKEFAVEFFRSGRENEGNVEHQLSVKGVTFFESYIKDGNRNIAPKEFEDLPDGTWFMSAKIDNDEVWDSIKNGEIKGFSIDLRAPIYPEEEIDSVEELMDYLEKMV